MPLKRLTKRLDHSRTETAYPQTEETVVVQPATRSNNGNVAQAFDAVAEIFDYSFEASPVIQRLRKMLYKLIERLVPPGSFVLDINCGTGIDAMFLANQGYRVVGIDISAKMIEQARRKLENDQRENVEFFVSSFEDIARTPGHRYDLVLSNFGGLNCTSNLDKVAEQVACVTRQGGFFVGVVMPPFCVWETSAGLIHGRWNYAFRRLRKDVAATGFPEKSFSVFYHSPRRLGSAFYPWFEVKKVYGLSIFSPPPNATSFINKHPRLTSLLERLDGMVQRLPLVRSVGDHFMVVLKKRES